MRSNDRLYAAQRALTARDGGSSTAAAHDCADAFGELAGLARASHPAVGIGVVDGERARRPGTAISRPFLMTCRLPATLTGTTGSPASIATRNGAPLNRPTAPSTLRVPSGNTISECGLATSRAILLDDAGARVPAVDEQMTGPLEMPAEKREPPERLLGDDPQLQRQRREQDRDVVDALMVRGEHVAACRARARSSPLDRHPHAGRLRDQPRPRPRAAMRRSHRVRSNSDRDERGGPEHDRVER